MSADLNELHAGTHQLGLQCDTVIKFNFIFVPSRQWFPGVHFSSHARLCVDKHLSNIG